MAVVYHIRFIIYLIKVDQRFLEVVVNQLIDSCSTINAQDVALTGSNRAGLPCSVGSSTHAPGPAAADRTCARRPARPLAGSVTDDDER